MGLRRWIQKYLYRLVREEEELEEQATGWHRIAVIPCALCQRPIPPDSLFCRHCGFALVKTTQQTTGAQKLVATPVDNVPTNILPKPPKTLRAHVLTNQIEAALIPGEKHSRVRAYNRLKKQGQV